jgi:hypothetical protein
MYKDTTRTRELESQKLMKIREERIVLEKDVLMCTLTDKTIRSTK